MRIYVACLASYNAGTLHGVWIDADQDADSIWQEINDMLADSPEAGAEEWAIHDYEGFGPLRLDEYESIDRVAAITAAASDSYDEGAFFAWLDNDPSADLDGFSDCYCGEWDSFVAYAEDYVDSVGMLDSAAGQDLAMYFDYEKFANDLEQDYWTVDAGNGNIYVFRHF